MRAICVPCQMQYRCEKNEVTVEVAGALWSVDKWKCPGCGHEMMPTTRSSQRPFASLHLDVDTYKRVRKLDPPEVIVR